MKFRNEIVLVSKHLVGKQLASKEASRWKAVSQAVGQAVNSQAVSHAVKQLAKKTVRVSQSALVAIHSTRRRSTIICLGATSNPPTSGPVGRFNPQTTIVLVL